MSTKEEEAKAAEDVRLYVTRFREHHDRYAKTYASAGHWRSGLTFACATITGAALAIPWALGPACLPRGRLVCNFLGGVSATATWWAGTSAASSYQRSASHLAIVRAAAIIRSPILWMVVHPLHDMYNLQRNSVARGAIVDVFEFETALPPLDTIGRTKANPSTTVAEKPDSEKFAQNRRALMAADIEVIRTRTPRCSVPDDQEPPYSQLVGNVLSRDA